jgi:hypothetical protein
MGDFEYLIKNFMSIFIGVIISIVLSQECLIQPNIIKI